MKQPTDKDIIEAKGYVLAYYFSDLLYIDNFQQTKNSNFQLARFIEDQKRSKNSFRRFLWEFRIVRNVKAGQSEDLLKEVVKWTISENADSVDLFKELIRKKGLCHDKSMTSLCSKILFLNNPEIVYPYDIFAKITLGYRGNNYLEYSLKLTEFKTRNKTAITNMRKDLKRDLDKLDRSFFRIRKSNLDPKKVRENRIVDKLLWTTGKNYKNDKSA